MLCGRRWWRRAQGMSALLPSRSACHTASCCGACCRRRGVTVDQECEQLLSALPQERQRAVAEHFRSFSEHIT